MSDDFLSKVLKFGIFLVVAFLLNFRGFRDKIGPLFEKEEPKIGTPITPVKPVSASSGTYHPNFSGKTKINYDASAHCRTASGNTTFAGYDKGNNGVIVSTDKCINCNKSYFNHDK